jgi:hypothetical protein
MTLGMHVKPQNQLVGAFGERAVEAELLRRGWMAVNVNASVKNSADFDIFALRNGRTVQVRVKTCNPDAEGFQYSFPPNAPIPTAGITESDFTVLVRMGKERGHDTFYVMPTAQLRQEVSERQKAYLSVPTRKGSPRKDTGQWALHFRRGTTVDEAWKKYLDAWEVLDGQSDQIVPGSSGLEIR